MAPTMSFNFQRKPVNFTCMCHKEKLCMKRQFAHAKLYIKGALVDKFDVLFIKAFKKNPFNSLAHLYYFVKHLNSHSVIPYFNKQFVYRCLRKFHI